MQLPRKRDVDSYEQRPSAPHNTSTETTPHVAIIATNQPSSTSIQRVNRVVPGRSIGHGSVSKIVLFAVVT